MNIRIGRWHLETCVGSVEGICNGGLLGCWHIEVKNYEAGIRLTRKTALFVSLWRLS